VKTGTFTDFATFPADALDAMKAGMADAHTFIFDPANAAKARVEIGVDMDIDVCSVWVDMRGCIDGRRREAGAVITTTTISSPVLLTYPSSPITVCGHRQAGGLELRRPRL
jgi:hypothetical protein